MVSRRRARYLLLLGALLAGLGLLAARFLDPANLQATLVSRVQAATGRELAFDGGFEVDYWPKLSLRLGATRLGNAAGFGEEPMLAFERLETALALLPLLRGEVELDTLVIDGLRVNLARLADGRSNWEDLAGEDRSPTTAGGPWRKLAAVALGGVDLRHADLHWLDAAAGQALHLTGANLQLAALAFGEPVEFALRAALKAGRPAVEGTLEILGTATYDPRRGRYTVAPLALGSRLTGTALPGGRTRIDGKARLQWDPDKNRLAVEDLALEGLGHRLDGELTLAGLAGGDLAIKGDLVAKGRDLASLLRALEHPLATRVARLAARETALEAAFDLTPAAGNLHLGMLRGELLGTRIEATAEATSLWRADTARFQATLDLRGNDLPGLVLVLNQLLRPDAPARGALSKALGAAGDRRFTLTARGTGDLAQREFTLPEFTLKALGVETHLQLETARSAQEGAHAQGGFRVKGADVRPLLLAGASLGGLSETDLSALSKLLATRKQPGIAVEAGIDLDLDSHQLRLAPVAGKLLGNPLEASFDTVGAQTLRLALNGSDLPALFGLGGALAAQPGLVAAGSRLASIPGQPFTLQLGWVRKPGSGAFTLAPLTAQGYGLTLAGELEGQAKKSGGADRLAGHLVLKGAQLAPLLEAFGQAALGSRLDTVQLEAAVQGSSRALTLPKLEARAELSLTGQKKRRESFVLALTGAQADLTAGAFGAEQISLTGPGLKALGKGRLTMVEQGGLEYEAEIDLPAFDLRRMLVSLGQPLPASAAASTLTRVGLQLRANGKASVHQLQDLKLTLDDSTLSGEMTLTQEPAPALGFKLALDKLETDHYLGPTKAGEAQPVTPEMVALGAARLPLAMLRALQIEGSLSCGSLRHAGARLSGIELTLHARGGKLALDPVRASLYGGRYQGRMGLDVSGEVPKIELNSTLAKVNLAPLLKDVRGSAKLSGVLNFEAKLAMHGREPAQQLRSLDGPASFALIDGEMHGLDLPAVLRAAELTLESKRPALPPRGGRTRFESISGSLQIARGVVKNQDLLLKGAGFQVTGRGMLADLPRQRVDYIAELQVPPQTTAVDGSHYHLGDYAIPIRCEGPLAVKSCLPDLAGLAGLAGKAAGKTLQRGVEKLLEEKAGGAGKAIRKLLEF